jgi:hypothetical protein
MQAVAEKNRLRLLDFNAPGVAQRPSITKHPRVIR